MTFPFYWEAFVYAFPHTASFRARISAYCTVFTQTTEVCNHGSYATVKVYFREWPTACAKPGSPYLSFFFTIFTVISPAAISDWSTGLELTGAIGLIGLATSIGRG